MCGMDATDNDIGDAGAVALGETLGSGQCQLKSLVLAGESVCLAACGACFLRSVARVRAGWRACVALWDAERLRVSWC